MNTCALNTMSMATVWAPALLKSGMFGKSECCQKSHLLQIDGKMNV